MPIQLLISLGLAVWDRTREPSTHAGLAALALALAHFMPAEYAPVAQAIAAVFGSLATVFAEKGGQ